ncbi:MAG: hypothetical protein NVS1B13_26000 [Flavisolibacter sp.]
MERMEKLIEFLAANPTDSFLQHALALEFVKLEDDKKARQIFEKLLSENPRYVGSYYHLGKLLERNNEKETALHWFSKGMVQAKEAGDNHSYNELLAAFEEIND